MQNNYSTFERIWNVQILALQTVFICLLSLPFLCIFYHCDVTLFTMTCSVTCSLTLSNITENSYVKCPVHFFRWNSFSSPVWSTRRAIVFIQVVSIRVRIHVCVIVLCANLSNLTYFDNHLSESIHFWTIFFHSPVILLYILKTIWSMNIILWNHKSVWTDVCLKINAGDCDLYFMVQWFCFISWRLFDIWTSYFRIVSQYDTTFDLKINVGHCDLYFMGQWFCLISWRLFDIWTPYFGIMSQYDQMFNLKCRSLWPIFHGPVVLKTVCCMNIILQDNESVWHDI